MNSNEKYATGNFMLANLKFFLMISPFENTKKIAPYGVEGIILDQTIT